MLCDCIDTELKVQQIGNTIANCLMDMNEQKEVDILALPEKILKTEGFRIEIMEDEKLLHFWQHEVGE